MTVISKNTCPVCNSHCEAIFDEDGENYYAHCGRCGYTMEHNTRTEKTVEVKQPYGVTVITPITGAVVVQSLRSEEEYKDLLHSMAADPFPGESRFKTLETTRYIKGEFKTETVTNE
jgi:Zn ribbon nucleic-acid-binding protein